MIRLKELEISAVVNCTLEMENFHEGQGDIEYLRFCISSWSFGLNKKVSHEEAVLQFVDVALDQIDLWLAEGKHVFIHCLAGAHRAGTTTVLLLMRKYKLKSETAVKLAKHRRPLINPIYRLGTLLKEVDKAVEVLKTNPRYSKASKWFR